MFFFGPLILFFSSVWLYFSWIRHHDFSSSLRYRHHSSRLQVILLEICFQTFLKFLPFFILKIKDFDCYIKIGKHENIVKFIFVADLRKAVFNQRKFIK